jgi:threonine dehydrogenase-like Zn-dependent dehydrogenase
MSGAANGTMKAAVIEAPSQLRVVDAPVPDPGPGQVRVRLEGCGVCASNIPPWEGRDWYQYPFPPGEMGHEGWGAVDAVGEGVSDLKVRDRVAFLSNKSYAQFDVAPAENAVKVPDSLADAPFPGEPLGCAMNIFKRSEVRAGQTVAILGIGFLGALLTQLSKRAGARVIAVSRRPFSLDVAKQCGADETVPWGDRWEVINRVAELTGGVGGYGEIMGWCDRVIECTGKQEGLDLIGEITAVRGRAVIAGFHQDGHRTVDMQYWNWRGLDVINAHERDPKAYLDGIRAAVDAVAEGTLNPGPLYTHRFPLDGLGDALNMTRDRPDGFLKALVMM